MKTLTHAELKTIFDRVLETLSFHEPQGVKFSEDYYRIIPTHSWNLFDEPVVHSCSLYDDIEELGKLVTDPDRPCTFVDFDRLAAVLRAISHLNNP
jgi:hypothetical protein